MQDILFICDEICGGHVFYGFCAVLFCGGFTSCPRFPQPVATRVMRMMLAMKMILALRMIVSIAEALRDLESKDYFLLWGRGLQGGFPCRGF